jgi:hypothetical protein
VRSASPAPAEAAGRSWLRKRGGVRLRLLDRPAASSQPVRHRNLVNRRAEVPVGWSGAADQWLLIDQQVAGPRLSAMGFCPRSSICSGSGLSARPGSICQPCGEHPSASGTHRAGDRPGPPPVRSPPNPIGHGQRATRGVSATRAVTSRCCSALSREPAACTTLS